MQERFAFLKFGSMFFQMLWIGLWVNAVREFHFLTVQYMNKKEQVMFNLEKGIALCFLNKLRNDPLCFFTCWFWLIFLDRNELDRGIQSLYYF